MNTALRLITLLTLVAAPGLATASEAGAAIGGAGGAVAGAVVGGPVGAAIGGAAGAAGGSAVTDHDNDATGSTDCRSATVHHENSAEQSSTTTKRTCD